MILRPKSREKGIGAVELLEQATALLRQASLDTLACYYLGTVPFLLCCSVLDRYEPQC